MTPLGIEPATFRILAQCLNQLRYRVTQQTMKYRAINAGDCPVHRLRKSFFLSLLTGAQDSHLKKVTIPEAAYIQLRRRPPDDEQGNARNM